MSSESDVSYLTVPGFCYSSFRVLNQVEKTKGVVFLDDCGLSICHDIRDIPSITPDDACYLQNSDHILPIGGFLS